MRQIIRLGDSTDHGGKVIQTAARQFKVDGVPVARKGDRCSCPREGHQDCVIIEGDEHFKVDGVPVAFEGHKTSCGATLIATVATFGTT
ncbi:PAAR domain-containing protein [Ralstonia pseudosolanacearum]|uniref:PAAR domain-containing protein n=1 Tax=Ralstonia pseudosolanacearum TaxID=1310165 RepID=UPI002109F9B8|nr:PAAR domain-containing protein [Ralstonia pseudosolanacearum]MCQ4680272.1 PAAR domain-containing protein [Ralstonia pseudosolanacearum]